MYIDSSRLQDLHRMKSEMDDINRPMVARQRAYRVFQQIMRQIHDPVLANMRERLSKAHDAHDKTEIWKITNQIKDYLKEPILEEGTI